MLVTGNVTFHGGPEMPTNAAILQKQSIDWQQAGWGLRKMTLRRLLLSQESGSTAIILNGHGLAPRNALWEIVPQKLLHV